MFVKIISLQDMK